MKCTSDFPHYIAAFLIGAGAYFYFGCGNWISERDGTEPFIRCPEYDKPLGAPKDPAQYNGGVWTRSFASGTKVMFDTKRNKGIINWGSN